MAFFKFNNQQHLHLTAWEDAHSVRGHICMQVDDVNALFFRMKALGIIDIQPWGKVRRPPDGAIQIFVRDPSENLVELSSDPEDPIDPKIFKDELYQEGIYVSGRNDFRGYKSKDATLSHKNNWA